ncbi:MAG: hypothetical protein RLZZ142_1393 [Verrucomicrobiota bacterium]|jgi:hypothetical protein
MGLGGVQPLPMKTFLRRSLSGIGVLKRLLSLSLSFVLAPVVSANDTGYGFQNGTFRFEKNPDVALQKETLTIGIERITVDYVFKNESVLPQVIPTVFPMPPMRVVQGDVNGIGDFQVLVDGQVLKTRRHLVALFGELDITPELRQAGWDERKLVTLLRSRLGEGDDAENTLADALPEDWVQKGWVSEKGVPRFSLQEYFTWELELKPQQTRSVRHTYRPSFQSSVAMHADWLLESNWEVESWPQREGESTGSLRSVPREADPEFVKAVIRASLGRNGASEGGRFFCPTYLEYKLTTGANWRGPIRDFTLIIRKPSADTLVTMFGNPQIRAMEMGQPEPGTLVFHATDFVPREELRFLFARPEAEKAP